MSELVRRLVKRYGTTDNLSITAFIIPDGRLVPRPRLTEPLGEWTHFDMARHAFKRCETDCLTDFLQETGSIRIYPVGFMDQAGVEFVSGRNRPTEKQMEPLSKICEVDQCMVDIYTPDAYRCESFKDAGLSEILEAAERCEKPENP